MPSNTPGRRKGSHASQPRRELNESNRLPELHEELPGRGALLSAPAARPIATTAVAETAARENEFQTALCPAASAPGSSVQVRFTEINWKTGRPTASRQSRMVQAPHTQNQPGPSCCRNSLAETGPSVRGHGNPRRAHQSSRISGTITSGQLNWSAPRVSKVVLNRTHTSAGKTFTCKIAGTAKLFSARTNVSTAAWVRAVCANGQSRPRINHQPLTATSLSSCDGSSRCQALSTISNVIGQVSRLRIQTVPPSETMLSGSQPRHTPAYPRKCSQQLVTRNGGKASAITATANRRCRQPRSSPASHSAAKKPKLTATSVVRSEEHTSELQS